MLWRPLPFIASLPGNNRADGKPQWLQVGVSEQALWVGVPVPLLTSLGSLNRLLDISAFFLQSEKGEEQ